MPGILALILPSTPSHQSLPRVLGSSDSDSWDSRPSQTISECFGVNDVNHQIVVASLHLMAHSEEVKEASFQPRVQSFLVTKSVILRLLGLIYAVAFKARSSTLIDLFVALSLTSLSLSLAPSLPLSLPSLPPSLLPPSLSRYHTLHI